MKNGLWALVLGGFFVLNPTAFAADEEDLPPPAGEPTLATPVSPAPATPPAEASAGTAVKAPTPSEQAPIPLSSIPGKTAQSPSKAAPPAPPKDIYEEYYEYKEREKERASSEFDYQKRNLFAHEDGGWQFGLEYLHQAFANYNFNFKMGEAGRTDSLRNNVVNADTQGAMLSLGYFPLRSLTFGRLGVIGQAGIYFSKFSIDTPVVNGGTPTGNTVKDDVKRHQAESYGVRGVYEFQYFLGQMLVPFVTLGIDSVRMHAYKVAVNTATTPINVLDIPARTVVSQSYGAGLNFNLNRIEPIVASRALVSVGVKKFYLSYMALQRVGDLSGLSHSLGLRFEF